MGKQVDDSRMRQLNQDCMDLGGAIVSVLTDSQVGEVCQNHVLRLGIFTPDYKDKLVDPVGRIFVIGHASDYDDTPELMQASFTLRGGILGMYNQICVRDFSGGRGITDTHYLLREFVKTKGVQTFRSFAGKPKLFGFDLKTRCALTPRILENAVDYALKDERYHHPLLQKS